MQSLPSAVEVRERLEVVTGQIEQVANGRPVRVIAVTKTWPVEVVLTALEVGLIDIGENYAQEMASKVDEMGQLGDTQPRWHFVGGLQRNKVKLLAGSVHLWQTIDRMALIDEVAKRSPGGSILIQVNTTGEPQKSGCSPGDVSALVDHGRSVGLDVQGLMTLGPTGGGDPRSSFAELAHLADQHQLSELSMGMTNDYTTAVAEGSTMVRIGSAFFGRRPT